MNTSDEDLDIAASLLTKNELVVIPTETVYGLAANAFSLEAIHKIYATKNRPPSNPLIVHIASMDDLPLVAKNIPESAMKLAKAFWPGPLTLLLQKTESINSVITAGKETVAVRIPNHEKTLKLLRKLSFPLVAPSANRSNHISPTQPIHVKKSIGINTPYIVDGGVCAHGIESTIVGFHNEKPVIYRLGAIDKETLEKTLAYSIDTIRHTTDDEGISPGMSRKHYSPTTPFRLTNNLNEEISKYPGKRIGILAFKEQRNYSVNARVVLSLKGDLAEAAANLYRALHQLDELQLDIIIAERIPGGGLADSINDRLIRAAST